MPAPTITAGEIAMTNTTTSLRAAIAMLENKNVWEGDDKAFLDQLRAELHALEAPLPSRLYREMIELRRQRDRAGDCLRREIGRMRRLKEEGLPAEPYDRSEWDLYRALHGKTCARLKAARARWAASKATGRWVVGELLAGGRDG